MFWRHDTSYIGTLTLVGSRYTAVIRNRVGWIFEIATRRAMPVEGEQYVIEETEATVVVDQRLLTTLPDRLHARLVELEGRKLTARGHMKAAREALDKLMTLLEGEDRCPEELYPVAETLEAVTDEL